VIVHEQRYRVFPPGRFRRRFPLCHCNLPFRSGVLSE
jgi:hypothetical protein